MKISTGITILFFSILFPSCNNDKITESVLQDPDTEACYPDSTQLKNYLSSAGSKFDTDRKLLSFYQKRNFVPAWITNEGVNEYAGNLINLLNNEEAVANTDREANLYSLRELYNYVLADTSQLCYKDSLALKLEVMLTVNFFEYARRNWNGVDDEILKQVNWFMKRKSINYEKILNDFLASAGKVSLNEPVYLQYGLLKKYLRKYYEVELIGGWKSLPNDIKLKKGDSSYLVPRLKQQLYVMDDLPSLDDSLVFSSTVEAGLKRFQKRHGLPEDGIIGGKTLKALRVPVHERIYQLLINMERSRWVPLEIKGDYILANIPQFQLDVYENNKHAWSCNVIVGKSNPVNSTVIFNDSVTFIVFSPYWNIPKNILVKETLPAIKKNINYLQKNNLEIITNGGTLVSPTSIDWNRYTDHFPYIIRERPGKNNSLGLIKFLFPNSYDIYMHDTPAKTLFSNPSRAFSHGCLRVEQPVKLAEFLLRKEPGWTTERIEELMNGGKETFIRLKKKVPVFITYFTAWVDREGKLNFREDVYGHDEKMKQLLFVN